MSETKLVINGAPLVWAPGGAGFSFYGIDAILFWVKPSLISMLQPLREEVGEELYSLLVAYEVSKGTLEDYNWMMNEPGRSFEEGFKIWRSAVLSCGWGCVDIQQIDWKNKTAIVSVENPWELKLFACKDPQNQIPFMHGKIAGVFSHAFGMNCRAEILEVKNQNVGVGSVVMRVFPSTVTLEDSLRQLHSETKAGEKTNLLALNNALRRNERRLLGMIDTVGDFIWESDLNLVFTYATEQIHRALQGRDESFIGKSWKELMTAEEVGRLNEMITSVSTEKPFAEGEFGIKGAGGEMAWLSLRAKKIFDFNGNHCGYVGSGRNITEKNTMRSELLDQQKNAEFSAKMATLGEMAGGVAHEINTPLATISLLAEQIVEDLDPSSPFFKPITNIIKTTDRIARIVQGLRTFARDASADPSEPSSIKAIFDATLELCQARFRNAGVELRVVPVSEELTAYCRSTQITQVLLNLLNNSFDAIAEIPEKWIAVDLVISEKTLSIQVTDCGAGIPPNVRQKMMAPFFTTKPIGKGTGLGLSISRGIVESHGGTLEYDMFCKNTRFTINLPIKDPSAESQKDPSEGPS